MRYLNTVMIMASSLILAVVLALAGCGDDHHGDHFRGDGDRHPANERHDSDHHDDHGGDSGHDHDDHGER